MFLNVHHQGLSEVSQEELTDLFDYQCSREDAALLVRPVQVEEIREVSFSMTTNKAAGQDSYHIYGVLQVSMSGYWDGFCYSPSIIFPFWVHASKC